MHDPGTTTTEDEDVDWSAIWVALQEFDATQAWLSRVRSEVVEMCAKELEWMARGHVAHECDLLRRAAQRLRDEADKIMRRAAGERV